MNRQFTSFGCPMHWKPPSTKIPSLSHSTSASSIECAAKENILDDSQYLSKQWGDGQERWILVRIMARFFFASFTTLHRLFLDAGSIIPGYRVQSGARFVHVNHLINHNENDVSYCRIVSKIAREWKHDCGKYLRIADECDSDTEPSFHATTVLAYRFVAETAVEKIHALQGFLHCLD